jgi:transcriptional regulator
MYNPPAFAVRDRTILHELLRAHSFATIVGIVDGAVHFAYAPTLFRESTPHGRIQFHLARANPLAGLDNDATVCLSFWGPHAYVSPNWYANKAQVPTWNYIVTEGSGRIRRLNDDELRRQLQALSAENETPLRQDMPWSPVNVPQDQMRVLITEIAGFEVELSSLEGKLKMSQNMSAVDIAGVIAGLEKRGDPASISVAEAMKRYVQGGM